MSDHPTIAADETTAGARISGVVIPHQIGPVRLISEIGRGAMGIVWRGRHELLDRDVAVKFLSCGIEADAGLGEFIDGARAAAAIRHSGITTVHNADIVSGLAYVVMDFIDGPTLAVLVCDIGPLSVPAAAATLCRICDAIAHLHETDKVHRDIKPANILLDVLGNVVFHSK